MEETTEREIVSFKGTRQGILMSIVEDEAFSKALDALKKKMESNESFFTGSPVSLDLGWRELDSEDIEGLLGYFRDKGIRLLGIISTSLNTRKLCEERGLKVIIGRLGLADHHGRQKLQRKLPPSSPVPTETSRGTESIMTAQVVPEMKTSGETYMIKKTVRSGQTIDFPGNLIIMGDVNPGAEVKAGGDIVILGCLRGIAYAGASSKSEDPTIFALKFQPTLIRIGDQLTNKFDKKFTRCRQPVFVKLKNGKIDLVMYS
jgi:septum site-determining protein MinC